MEKLIFGLTVTVISVAIVFFGLAMLIGLIKIMVGLTDGKDKNGKKTDAVPEIISDTAESELLQNDDMQDDGETVAAIMAAISCMLDEGQQFTVRRIRRIRN